MFDNRFIRELPGEAVALPGVRQVHGALWSPVTLSPVGAPELLGWSQPLAAQLGIERPEKRDAPWWQALAGNALMPGMQAYAGCYGGHQFGHWAGQLGDGRAISLGEWQDGQGHSWELQLKGAGPTPYSRSADGRAVLRSSLREFLCSEAMYHLGVPTTRALSLMSTGETVVRDMFYDGHPAPEPGAVVCRTAPSFLRFGHFELLAARQDSALLRRLIGHAIRTHDAHWLGTDNEPDIAGWFQAICERTAEMVAEWMRVGFVHGVMNTDNMSIHGLTIDYGPYGWLEPYDPAWTPNTTDAQGRRYCFARQPAIAQWNLACLAGALQTLLPEPDALEEGLAGYARRFEQAYAESFARKLGLRTLTPGDDLLVGLFDCMQQQETDYCISFRQLAKLPWLADAGANPSESDLDVLQPALYQPLSESAGRAWLHWMQGYRQRLGETGLPLAQRCEAMRRANPKYVLRNYLAQQAIDAASLGDTRELERLQKILQRPYDEQPEHANYAARRPEWARHKAGCSALSCSS